MDVSAMTQSDYLLARTFCTPVHTSAPRLRHHLRFALHLIYRSHTTLLHLTSPERTRPDPTRPDPITRNPTRPNPTSAKPTPPSAVLPSRFFSYFQANWGRHSVVSHRNRSLRLGMAGRGSGDTIIRLGWHVQRLRKRESSSHGQVPGLCITVIMQFHEFRRGRAPGALRRDHCQHGMLRTAADRPPPSIIAIVPVNSASVWQVPHCGDSIRGTLTLTVFLVCVEVF